MNNMGKSFALILILIMLVSSLTLMGIPPSVKAQTGTNISSQVINQDTTWTKAGSPYIFRGPVGVASGVTLTIDAGVTVYIGNFQLNVNGTLNVQGTSTDKVVLNSLPTDDSPAQQINLRGENPECTIENAILNTTAIFSGVGASMKISNCFFNGTNLIGAAGIDAFGGSAVITNNYIAGGVAASYSSIISDNMILEGIFVTGSSNNVVISGNNVTNSGGIVMNLYGVGTISDNIISGGSVGVAIEPEVSDTIEGNLITNNQCGISISTSVNSLLPPVPDKSIIENNTIANNGEGIGPLSQETIIYNNFQNNEAYNLVNGASDVNATYNWWGTTNTQTINQSIYDNKNDYNLGVVTFVPFLNAPNPEAPAIITPIPSLAPTSSPSQSSSSPSPQPSHSQTPTSTSTPAGSGINSLFLLTITIALVVIAFLLAVIIALLLYVRKRNRLLESSIKGLTRANLAPYERLRVNRTNIRNRLMIGCPAP
jgi:hypothetical protein